MSHLFDNREPRELTSAAWWCERHRVDEKGTSIRVGEQVLSLPPSLRSPEVIGPYRGREVIVGIRPEHLRDPALLAEEPDAHGLLRGDVDLTESLGSEKLVHFRIDARATGWSRRWR